MKSVILTICLLACLTSCSPKKDHGRLSDEEFLKLAQPGPAPGRAEFVSPVELISHPTTFHGKRVVLSGIWTVGFEHSMLEFEDQPQKFWIWVDLDWSKIDGPMGDFTRRKEASRTGSHDFISHRVVAEGTFYYREIGSNTSVPGFGHMSVSPGYF